MRIGSKSKNKFFLGLDTKNQIIQNKFLKKISDATKTVNAKVMLGDSTVKEINTFDPKNIEDFFNHIRTNKIGINYIKRIAKSKCTKNKSNISWNFFNFC